MNSRSMSPPKPSTCWTLDTADRSTLPRSRAIVLRVNCRMAIASLTLLLRIRSHTRPAFWAEVRTPRAVACASTAMSRSLRLGRRGRRRRRRGFLGLGGVATERARRRELAQLVPDHVLGDVDGNELLPVVHRHGVPDHLGDHRRSARPRLDHALLVDAVHLLDLLEQRRVDERTLLQ